MKNFYLGKKKIGTSYPVYFIADIAANHDGDIKRAQDLIYLAAECGADAAKFQNFKVDKIVSKYGFKSLKKQLAHQKSWKNSVYETYQKASLKKEWTPILKDTCQKAGIEYFTSPYDFDSVDAVYSYVSVYKIGSGDITWLEIIDYICKKKKPIILATGASSIEDVKQAMNIILNQTKKVVLMQCNTNYTNNPDNFKFINLNVLKLYHKLYPNVVLGLSDHTPGHTTVLGAISLGTKVIEKHFTDINNREGPDHIFSMNPRTWKEMVERTRELESSLGDGIKRIEKNEGEAAIVQRRALRTTRRLKIGEILHKGDLEPLRPIPKDGIAPYLINRILGQKLIKPLSKGEHITVKHVKYSKE